jgi:phenylacetate-coenzyme A ligase PaaK-like adenylate-forming protein
MHDHELDSWIGALTGLDPDPDPAELEQRQFMALRRALARAVERSPFYRRLYAGHDLAAIDSRASLARLPRIDGDILREQGTAMVCLPQTRIERISSMLSSGSTGRPKCIYFSAADLEHTVDFFDHGMRLMCGPEESVLICMNGATPYSVGDLLSRGLQRFGAEPHILGEVGASNLAEAAAATIGIDPHTIVGIPRQMLALAEHAPGLRPVNVLLSADNVPRSLSERIAGLWQCEVFTHWGMRETCLGGGVECASHDGHHLRHADLLIEIIDPESGVPLHSGQRGEVVISTLRREAMPLFRYRCGDLSHLITAPCCCGSRLPRLGAVQGHYRTEEKQ